MRIGLAALWFFLPLTVWAQADPPNGKCLGCHGEAGRKWFIDRAKFATTGHSTLGCISCHSAAADAHPGGGRVGSVACKSCHEATAAEYARSVHGGNALCTDCHSPHEARPPGSVSGDDMNRQCLECHESPLMSKIHGKWLPQVDLHMQALPCITCHSGSPNYVITLFVESANRDGKQHQFHLASFEELRTLAGDNRRVDNLIDRNNDGFVSLAELRTFHSASHAKGMRLRGMMMPERMTHSMQILMNRWDCTFCHASGPDARQTSFVAFPQADGTYSRVEVEKGAVLDVLRGTPDFYMVGATRSFFLSVLGGVIVAVGALFPVFHGAYRTLKRRDRKRKGE